MVRDVSFRDMPRLLEIFHQMHEASTYAEDYGVDEPTLRALIMDGVKRQGSIHNGGTLFLVVEKDGKIVGFMLGIFERVYHFLNRLRATDVFLFCEPGAPFRASERMIDRYISWALANPKCAEVMLSHTDAISPDAQRIERLYASKGFRRCGGIWQMEIERGS